MEEDNFIEEDFDMDDFSSVDNEEELSAVSLHDDVVIFNRSDGTWYSRSYENVEIAQKIYEIESNRLNN